MERRLSGRPRAASEAAQAERPGSRPKRAQPVGPVVRRSRPAVAYAELHAHSNFSFLDGAAHPEQMVQTAAELGLAGLALLDHDGMYGVVRFAEAAAEVDLPTVFGAELSLGLSGPQNGIPDPEGAHLVVLARDVEGYRSLCRIISQAHATGREKGRPVYPPLEEIAAAAAGHWLVLTGCRKGTVPAALESVGVDAARLELDRLIGLFGRDNMVAEIWDHDAPTDDDRADALTELATSAGVGVVATTNAHCATPKQGELATALAAVRARRSLDEIDGWLPNVTSFLRSGEEMAARFARHRRAIEASVRIAGECAFDLRLVAPELPPFPVPPGHSEISWLRHLTMVGASERYGPPGNERIPGAYAQVEKELRVIEALNFPGYFLIVWDIVRFCTTSGILCQGRGSAANSAVCYAIGITVVDPVHYGLLFERFLAPEREGPPDIDLDIAAGRREEVIQYVYSCYGRERAALVANLITYRPRSAVRDMAKALGYSPGQQDAYSKQLERHGGPVTDMPDHTIPAPIVELADQVRDFPRHLGIHPGGMVICDRPVHEVIPVEWARMKDRTVIQQDKDGAAALGLVKFDLLGLGMLSALQLMLELIPVHYGDTIDLAALPADDPEVFAMLRAADTVGVFQVESRAQMSTLPRLKPRCFYDLVVEVGLIRPGPIQGGSVHPYLRRHSGQEPVTYPHPLLKPALEKTLGIPIFQEQMMQMAIDAASFTAAEADELRRAMGAKRSAAKMRKLMGRLITGMERNGITGQVAEDVIDKLAAFANFGFAESHAISFAYIVYASAYLKRFYPAAFYAGLLGAQPMGFYSPQSLVADAKRHGLTVLPVDINRSGVQTTLEAPVPVPRRAGIIPLGRDGQEESTIRIGLAAIRHLGTEHAERLVTAQPYTDIDDLAHRGRLNATQLEALATSGALDRFGLDRRQAIWAAGLAATTRPGHLPGLRLAEHPPKLPLMSEPEQLVADVWATGITATYPTALIREDLDRLGVIPANRLPDVPDGTRILTGGVVTHRQRPGTAGGITFLSLEDETGLINVVVSVGVWNRHRTLARDAGALLIRGRIEHGDGAINLIAEHLHPMTVAATGKSRDFH